jgi:glycosyltransferase involved in cell wall biosynthesis
MIDKRYSVDRSRNLAIPTGEGAGHPSVVAVLIAYNSEHLVERAILSLLRQTYPFIRRVVIDDGSRDRTLQVVSKYRSVLEIHQNHSNVGFSASLNRALDLAASEEFLFVHQDDVKLDHSEYVEKLVAQARNVRAAVVTGQMIPVRDSVAKRIFSLYLDLDIRGGQHLYEVSWPHLKADLFRVSALRSIGGFAYAGNYRLGVEDQILGYSLHKHGFLILKDPQCHYHVDFARCETIGEFVLKEADTGRCLGAAVGLGFITPNPNRSKSDLVRRNHRLSQVAFFFLLSVFLILGAFFAWGLLCAAAVLAFRVASFLRSANEIRWRERLLAVPIGLAIDMAFTPSFFLGLTQGLAQRLSGRRRL